MRKLSTQKMLNRKIKLENLAALYQFFKKHEDEANANKIMDLYEKLNKKEMMISFAGHFSAGKSSMINTVIGEEILPKSPIPTSANVVKINSGDGVARVYLNDGEIIEFKEPYDIDVIKEYSKDKSTIKKIEISTAKELIPSGCAIMDTPGIDAADDADRIITEGSIHLVDILFYVMDYNHVQSEVNLQFLQSIQEKGIPFYVIVNQIDKHDEHELTFAEFKQRILYTFDQWNLKPVHVYYSSLINKGVANNDIDKIIHKLHSLMNDETLLQIDSSTKQVINDHKRFLKEKFEDYIGDEINNDIFAENLETYRKLQKEIERLESIPSHIENEFNNELMNTLSNAYLMPARLRDKAESFIESQQSTFKVGFFGSKKKTKEEQEKRIQEFIVPLQENIEASIQWKLRDKFLSILNKYEIENEEVKTKVQSLTVSYSDEEIKRLLKPGATVNGDYILNYTNDVANDVKNKFKQKSRDLLEFIIVNVKEIHDEKIKTYHTKLNELNNVKELNDKQHELQNELHDKYQELEDQLINPFVDEKGWEQIQSAITKKYEKIQFVETPKMLEKEELQPETEWKEIEKSNSDSITVENTLKLIETTMEAIESLPGFDTFKQELLIKQNRLLDRSFTIALFGAFSAGKSSFANALIGDSVLPVSPNPTTATVNRICPVSDEFKHGTVVVTLKDEEALSNDLISITKKFSPKKEQFGELLYWVQSENIHQSKELNKMYQSYLTALISGYTKMGPSIGKKITIGLNEFVDYVTNENIACYIAGIDLYYDCHLTRHGITLVDTPGADSVNARHTNVAFDYIKQADAILYVTYYNHALSRADRDFLTQLGRVKDTFQLDKMFFIVNAADLASDEKELNLVVSYVEEQLLKLGIRLPKLYPLSSKLSLQEKVKELPLNRGMKEFETFFYKFILEDLSTLTVESTIWDIRRIYHSIGHYIETLQLGEEEKEQRLNELITKENKLVQEITNTSTSIYIDRIYDKIDKQLFYVMERLSIRFHDMFKEFFNPTTVTESGKKAQSQLKKNVADLLEYISFELYQELQAVALRIEAFIQSEGENLYESFQKKSLNTDNIFELSKWNAIEVETPEFDRAFEAMDYTIFNKAINNFKGTKAFFEKNEKEQMKDELYKTIQPMMKEYISQNKFVMNEAYKEVWSVVESDIKHTASSAIRKQVENYNDMMHNQVDVPVLMEKTEVIQTALINQGLKEV